MTYFATSIFSFLGFIFYVLFIADVTLRLLAWDYIYAILQVSSVIEYNKLSFQRILDILRLKLMQNAYFM